MCFSFRWTWNDISNEKSFGLLFLLKYLQNFEDLVCNEEKYERPKEKHFLLLITLKLYKSTAKFLQLK